jgi:Na+-driven multidrug efflux pump
MLPYRHQFSASLPVLILLLANLLLLSLHTSSAFAPRPTSVLLKYNNRHQSTMKRHPQHSSDKANEPPARQVSLPLWNNNEKQTADEGNVVDEETSLLSSSEQKKQESTPSKTSKQYSSTGAAILDLAIPALGALLIDPLMTLADTAFVGRFSGGDSADSLAGMGSAAALLTFSFYLFGFLTKVTTPLVSSKRASGNEPAAMAIGGQALSLALGLGLCLTLVLLVLQAPLLNLMGAVDAGPAAYGYATDFLVIRALAAPAVLSISACTGILRGYLDTKTPIVILVAANLLNFALDVVLIVFGHLGPLGAAIATTSAEWISALLFLGVLSGRLPSAAGELGSNQDSSTGKLIVGADDGSAQLLSIVPTLTLPPWEEIEPLVVASSSVFLRSLVLQAALSSAAASAARNGNAMAAASLSAHQIGIQLWLLCSFISDALAAASQGLVADALGRNSKQDARDISKIVFVYSLGLGLTLGSLLFIGSESNFLLDFFTTDSATKAELARILPLIIFSQPLNSYVFATDGVIEGASEFTFQAQSMLLSVFVATGLYMSLSGMGYSDGDTLVQVWTCLIMLQLLRGLTASWKIAQTDGPIDILAVNNANDSSR